MAQTLSDNLQCQAPKVLDNRSGRFESGVWRPYNNLAEFNSAQPLLARPETLIFWVRSTTNADRADLYTLDKNKQPYLVSPEVDLSNYYTKEEIDAFNLAFQNSLDSTNEVLMQESMARQDADTELQGQIDEYADDLIQEIQDREQADIDILNQVILNYYTKSVSDLRFLRPFESEVIYMQTFDVTKSHEIPSTTGIKDIYLVVDGIQGQYTASVVSGNQSAFTGGFPCVIYDGIKYQSYFCESVSSGVITLDTPLPRSFTNGSFGVMHDIPIGQHLTTLGYKAMGDYLYDIPPIYSKKNNFFIYDPLLTPGHPFTLLPNTATGGFIPGTTNLVSVVNPTTQIQSKSNIGNVYLAVQQGGVGRGIERTVAVGGKSGFFEMIISLRYAPYETGSGSAVSGGSAIINLYADNVLIGTKTITKSAFEIVRMPFPTSDVIRFTVETGDSTPTCMAIGRTGIYKSNESLDGKIFNPNDRVVFLGDSWTQYQLPNLKDFPERFKERFVADGGNASNVINNGRGGMTTAWGKYWFEELVINENPTHAIIEFFTNDQNSSQHVGNPSNTSWNFSNVSPFAAGIQVEGKVSVTDWKSNIDWMINKCLENKIQPIIVMPAHTSSISQTQTILSGWLPLLANDSYFDIKSLFSSNIVNKTVIETLNLIVSGLATMESVLVQKITGGKATVGGEMILETKQLNSSSNKGLIVRPDAFRNIFGPTSSYLTIQNGNGTNAYSDVFRFTGDAFNVLNNKILFGLANVILSGTGSPENVTTLPQSSLFFRTNGGLGTTAYLKETTGGNTGWKTIATHNSGTTANRPTVTTPDYEYFDTTLGRPIWWNGSAWVDLLNNTGLIGTPTAPTAAVGTNTTQVASTAFVQAILPIALITATDQTLGVTAFISYTGTGGTFTLPTPASSTAKYWKIIHRGASGSLVINTNGASNVLYNSGALTNTISLGVGEMLTLLSDGTYIIVYP